MAVARSSPTRSCQRGVGIGRWPCPALSGMRSFTSAPQLREQLMVAGDGLAQEFELAGVLRGAARSPGPWVGGELRLARVSGHRGPRLRGRCRRGRCRWSAWLRGPCSTGAARPGLTGAGRKSSPGGHGAVGTTTSATGMAASTGGAACIVGDGAAAEPGPAGSAGPARPPGYGRSPGTGRRGSPARTRAGAGGPWRRS